MKFEKFLNKEAVPEWRPKYLNYHLLKEHLRQIPLNRPDHRSLHGLNPEQCTVIEAQFFADARGELEKMNKFYLEKERELQEKWNKLLLLLSNTRSVNATDNTDNTENINNNSNNNKTNNNNKILKRNLINLYTEIDLLKSFQSLNCTALTKITKKFIKITANSRDAQVFLTDEVKISALWCPSAGLDRLMGEIEDAFGDKFAGGDRHRAMRQLRVRNFKNESFHSSALLAGSVWGITVSSWFYIVTWCLDTPHKWSLFYIYTSQFLPLISLGLFSLNATVFKRAFINYRFVFQFDKGSALHECQFAALTGLLACNFSLLALFAFKFFHYGPISSADIPILLPWLPLCLTLILSSLPVSFIWFQSRLWMFKTIARILTAPFCGVLFKDFFVNDHLISLALFFQGLLRAGGVNAEHWSVKIVSGFPYISRILQCLRRFKDTQIKLNLLNALKYSLALLLIILRAFLFNNKNNNYQIIISLHVLLMFISTMFSLYWDLVMDFGLLQSAKLSSLLLRDQLVVFSSNFFYYYVISFNTISRFTWILQVRQNQTAQYFKISKDFLNLLIGVVEIIRRFHWTFLRVEYEHLNNCNSFRAVEDLKLPSETLQRTADLFYQDMVISESIEKENFNSNDENDEEYREDSVV